jgi:uncharacterized membrane protein
MCEYLTQLLMRILLIIIIIIIIIIINCNWVSTRWQCSVYKYKKTQTLDKKKKQ